MSRVFKVIRPDQKTSHRGSIQFNPSGSGRTLNLLRKTKSRNSFFWTQSRASYFLHVELTSNNQIHVRYRNRPFQWGRFCTLHPSLIFVCLKPIRESRIDHNTHNKKNHVSYSFQNESARSINYFNCRFHRISSERSTDRDGRIEPTNERCRIDDGDW